MRVPLATIWCGAVYILDTDQPTERPPRRPLHSASQATMLRRHATALHARASRRRAHHHANGYEGGENGTGKLTIGIRKEDSTRIWERRCPLTPDAVHELVHKEGVDVLVQPCERRVWRGEEFVEVRPILVSFLSVSPCLCRNVDVWMCRVHEADYDYGMDGNDRQEHASTQPSRPHTSCSGSRRPRYASLRAWSTRCLSPSPSPSDSPAPIIARTEAIITRTEARRRQ